MKGKDSRGIGARVLILGLCVLSLASVVAAEEWFDNERQFKSNDPQYNIRRSEHFRIMWGKGVAANDNENADFPAVTEQLAQGNLQMLEQVWHVFHDAEPAGMGYHINIGLSPNPAHNDGKRYRANLMMNNTGIWAGGAWGACDEWGYPLFALPPSYLGYDPPSGATPHEYGHTVHINAGGFNDTPYDGMWHEAMSNWVMLQFNNAYPGPGFAIQPYLSFTHGRNYYDAWPLYEYLKDHPDYGYAFMNRLWTEANGNKAKGGEYMYDAMVRLDEKHAPDSYNAIKDRLGEMAAHIINWDFERGQFFRKHIAWNSDPMGEQYRRAFTELVRRNGDTNWYRVPYAHAPMQSGYNMVPIELNGKQPGQPYTVNVDFRPVWDPVRRVDMRATLVAISDNGEARYSTMWNGGVNSMTLADDENKLVLAVASTPDFMGYEGFRRPLPADLPLQPVAYEVSFPNCKALPYESRPAKPENVAGQAHSNGGGFVASTATVDATAYVGPNAMVLGTARVLGKARVEDYAVVTGSAVIKDNARVSGHALVKDSVQVYDNGKVRDWATVGGAWKIYENGRALERCLLMDRGEICGWATIKGNTCDYGNAKVSGTAIKEYDTANGVPIDKQTIMCWVWGFDQNYADRQPDNGGVYCGFHFEEYDEHADKAKVEPDGYGAYGVDADGKAIIYPRSNSIYAHDTFGVVHGYLIGSPRTVQVGDKGLGNVLPLNGKDQYVELRKDVADFVDTTIAMWVNWAGGAADQQILHYGDGAGKYLYLTPKNASGKLALGISVTGKQGEQTLVAPSALPANAWTHISITFEGDKCEMRLNGKPVATSTKVTLNPDDVLAANCNAGVDHVYLGRGPKGNYFKGMIDDFRVYCKPLDYTAIQKLAGVVTNPKAGVVASAKDADPMTPRFLAAPKAVDSTAVTMSATRPDSKTAWMEYYFTCTSGGGSDSGWISSNRYTDCGLKPGTYAYTVKMRNRDGKVSAASAPASVTVQAATAPGAAEFAFQPAGISDSAIKMAAEKIDGKGQLVEYKFTRSDGKTTGWQASPSWVDSRLSSGQTFSYTVQARVAGKAGAVSAAKTASAKDVTPPTQFVVGEWQTRPYAKLDNTITMKAMNVNEWLVESDPVEYYFRCVSGDGPDSGWQESSVFTTKPLADGTYVYEFKMRDKSAQKNETTFSESVTIKVSNLTGYHDYAGTELESLNEGALVTLKGTVSSVEKDHYVLSCDGVTCKVVPATKGDQTDPAMDGKEVTVQGCWWQVGDEMRVIWASVK